MVYIDSFCLQETRKEKSSLYWRLFCILIVSFYVYWTSFYEDTIGNRHATASTCQPSQDLIVLSPHLCFQALTSQSLIHLFNMY